MVKAGKTGWLAHGLVLLAVSSGGRAGAESVSYKIIVNETNPAKEETRKLVADLFLKKITRWPGGLEAFPVDQSSTLAVRERFSREILGDSVAGTLNYWQQQIFSGRGLPPPVKAEKDVIAFVQLNPGAIAYIAEETALPPGTKVLSVRK
jgi:ABC-type phosphate transport system substrate-binding protein